MAYKIAFKVNYILVLTLGILPILSFAAGFEKSVEWSAKYSALGGAAAADVQGADSLFFNPAGLTRIPSLITNSEQDRKDFTYNLSANFSPTMVKYKGPIVEAGAELETERSFNPVFGTLLSFKPNREWGFGVGAFVSGGSSATFKNVDFSALFSQLDTLKPNVSSQMSIMEISLGAAYQLTSEWSLGAAWRNSMVKANMSTAGVKGTGLSQLLLAVNLNDLSATNSSAFRVGLQYVPINYKWSLGLSLRTPIDFKLKGTSTGQFESVLGGDATDITGGTVEVSSSLPLQLSLGAAYHPSKDYSFFGEYTWTQYSKNENLSISGDITVATNTIPLPSIELNWFDLHNLRMGIEWRAEEDVLIRGAYVISSVVVPRSTATATMSSPGLGHTLVAGLGLPFPDQDLSVDFAFEYSFASGTVDTEQALSGQYATNAIGVHSSLAYHF